MSVRPIFEIGEPVLRDVARRLAVDELRSPDVQQLIDDLVDTMRNANGAGLAANQIGVPLQVCVVEVRPGNPRYPYKPPIPLTVLVNPLLEPVGDETFDNFEGCLSVPNLRGVVRRHAVMHVRALDRHGAPIDTTVAGLTACTYQHETDHLNGRLFIDRVTDTTTLCTWDAFERLHHTEFAQRVHDLVERHGS